MKTSILRSIAAAIVVLWTAVPAFSQLESEYKEQIGKINDIMKEAMLSGNSESLMMYYAKDAISMPSYEPMLIGIDAIRKSNDMMANSGMKVTAFDPKTLKVNFSGNLVTEVGTYKMSFTIQGMEMPMSDEGKYLTVYEVQDDNSLRILIETWNSDLNPMKQEEPAKPEKAVKKK
jgi:ketosteroid isomerase-like protein